MTCGVYEIWIDKYFYQGSSNDIESRIKRHLYMLKNNKHVNPKMQAVWNKYQVFQHHVLVECCESLIRIYEQDYIDANFGDKTYLNVSKSSKSPVTVPWNKGLVGVYSEESKAKMSAARKGKPTNKGAVSDEGKANISKSLIGNSRRSKKVIYNDIEYKSIKEACEILCLSRKQFAKLTGGV